MRGIQKNRFGTENLGHHAFFLHKNIGEYNLEI